MMLILRASAKVVAVLGIAVLVILLVAAVLYALQRTDTSGAQGVADDATEERPSTRAGANTVATPARTAEAPPRLAEPQASSSVPDSPSSAAAPSIAESEAPGATADAPEKATLAVEPDNASDTDATPLTASASSAPSTQESPPAASASSQAAAADSESPQAQPAAPDVRYYTVGSGDTLYRIARRVYGEGRHWRAVYEANRDLIDDPRELTLGWTLELPPLETVVAEN
jgi:nucleoid-associated protein YgaU